jgi:hypothetical protein
MPSALYSQTAAIATNPPITLRYIKTGEFNNGGYISSGTTFWATNHTSETLVISQLAVEAKAGANWITVSHFMQPLMFRHPGKAVGQPHLQPHDAGYATIYLPGQPTSGTWRVRGEVSEQLTGTADTVTRVWRYPSLMERRYRTGSTNIPANPFSTNMTHFKGAGQVVSQVISEE